MDLQTIIIAAIVTVCATKATDLLVRGMPSVGRALIQMWPPKLSYLDRRRTLDRRQTAPVSDVLSSPIGISLRVCLANGHVIADRRSLMRRRTA